MGSQSHVHKGSAQKPGGQEWWCAVRVKAKACGSRGGALARVSTALLSSCPTVHGPSGAGQMGCVVSSHEQGFLERSWLKQHICPVCSMDTKSDCDA